LAEKAGVTRQSVSAIETGRMSPTIEIALRLARALGRPVDSLFRLVEDTSLPADAVAGAGSPAGEPVRVQVARVGERIVARTLTGRNAVLSSLPWSNGLLRGKA